MQTSFCSISRSLCSIFRSPYSVSRCHSASLLAALMAVTFLFGLSQPKAEESIRPSKESFLKARKLFRRITGVPLMVDDQRYFEMAKLIESNDEKKAAAIATADPHFYQITLKNMAAAMANRTETPLMPLDDFQATFIGAVRDNLDARTLLTGNYIYILKDAVNPVSRRENRHYLGNGSLVNLKSALVKQEPQYSDLKNHAGLLTTRTWAAAHYDAGTNRRAVVYAIQEFLCTPIDSWKVPFLPDTYVGRDVDRCNGGKWDATAKQCVGESVDPKIYRDQCQTCHSGMDAQRGAFANLDFINGALVELPKGSVAPKYRHDSTKYPDGYITTDDSWSIPSAIFNSAVLGFDTNGPSSGVGINEYGQVLANSNAFKMCMAKRVFNQVCIRQPEMKDQAELKVLAKHFAKNDFNLKKLVEEAASLPACMGNENSTVGVKKFNSLFYSLAKVLDVTPTTKISFYYDSISSRLPKDGRLAEVLNPASLMAIKGLASVFCKEFADQRKEMRQLGDHELLTEISRRVYGRDLTVAEEKTQLELITGAQDKVFAACTSQASSLEFLIQ